MQHARLAFFFLLLSALQALPPQAPEARASSAPAAGPTPTFRPVSLRERRRITAILRLHLLELRAEGLARVRAVIERRLPIDALLAPPPSPSPAPLH